MNIQVRFFAQMAEQAGGSSFSIEVPADATLELLRAHLQKKHPHLRWPAGLMFAVNQEYAGPQRALQDHDEVAIIPPVSGG